MEPHGHALVKTLKNKLLPYRGESLVLAFSGGLDSLTMGQALSEIANDLSLKWSVAHIHHGVTESHEQVTYRDQALQSAEVQARKWNVPFHSRQSLEKLADNEEAFRDFRYAQLEAIRVDAKASYIVTAHHRDDLLETRLLRLLRGTGLQGLPAMTAVSGHHLRPWLDVARKDIEIYAQAKNLVAIDDPSNKNSTPMRNWIRNEWLVLLEEKQPGASEALARSLTHLAQSVAVSSAAENLSGIVWDRRRFADLSALDRKAAVAKKLRDLGARHFTQTHVEEIVKRLDTVQKRLDFVVSGVEFSLNAQQIHTRLQ